MRVLFAHQSFPAQFKYLAPGMARAGHEVIFMSSTTEKVLPHVRNAFYKMPGEPQTDDILLIPMADALRYARAARDLAIELRTEGFVPDLIVAHPGWGEAMFLKDVYPQAKLVCFLEFFFLAPGSISDLSQSELDLEDRAFLHMRNAPLLLTLEQSSWNISPTLWQKHLFPTSYQLRTTVLHEGINLRKFFHLSGTSIKAPDGTTVHDGMEIVTFVARYLEPLRGFYTFMRAAAVIIKARPNAHILIVGDEHGAYGPRPPACETHKEIILREVNLDMSRVHFFGQVGQSVVVKLLQMSRVHLFLTYPFLISWSVLEAMACGCVVLASDTGPVREIITHGENGLLIDLFDSAKFAETACEVLEDPLRFRHLGEQARSRVCRDFDALKNMNSQISLLTAISSGSELLTEQIVAF